MTVHVAERKVNTIFNTFHHAQNMRREIRNLIFRDFSYKLKPKNYETAEQAENLKEIKAITNSLGIILNHNKVKVLPLSGTFTFLQTKYFLTLTGKLVKRINPKRLTAMRRKLKKLSVKVKSGERSYELVRNLFRSWSKDFYGLMSKQQRQNMDKLYNDLFNKEEAEYEKSVHIRPKYRQIYWSGRS